jgi:hypothetical protein
MSLTKGAQSAFKGEFACGRVLAYSVTHRAVLRPTCRDPWPFEARLSTGHVPQQCSIFRSNLIHETFFFFGMRSRILAPPPL